jgi:hypothetical protein
MAKSTVKKSRISKSARKRNAHGKVPTTLYRSPTASYGSQFDFTYNPLRADIRDWSGKNEDAILGAQAQYSRNVRSQGALGATISRIV